MSLTCNHLQSGGRECLYNIGRDTETFPYWVALWWDEPVHFRLAQLAFGAASAGQHGDSYTCFWPDSHLPPQLRRHYQNCNRLAN